MKGLEKVLSRNFASLPQVTQEKFPPARIQAVVNMLTELVGHTEHIGPNELNRRPPELDKTRGRTNPPERLTLAKQTLLWWYFLVPSHPARWDEMYHLAKAWHLTASKDVESFRRYVLKCAQGVTRLVDPPHWTGV